MFCTKIQLTYQFQIIDLTSCRAESSNQFQICRDEYSTPKRSES